MSESNNDVYVLIPVKRNSADLTPKNSLELRKNVGNYSKKLPNILAKSPAKRLAVDFSTTKTETEEKNGEKKLTLTKLGTLEMDLNAMKNRKNNSSVFYEKFALPDFRKFTRVKICVKPSANSSISNNLHNYCQISDDSLVKLEPVAAVVAPPDEKRENGCKTVSNNILPQFLLSGVNKNEKQQCPLLIPPVEITSDERVSAAVVQEAKTVSINFLRQFPLPGVNKNQRQRSPLLIPRVEIPSEESPVSAVVTPPPVLKRCHEVCMEQFPLPNNVNNKKQCPLIIPRIEKPSGEQPASAVVAQPPKVLKRSHSNDFFVKQFPIPNVNKKRRSPIIPQVEIQSVKQSVAAVVTPPPILKRHEFIEQFPLPNVNNKKQCPPIIPQVEIAIHEQPVSAVVAPAMEKCQVAFQEEFQEKQKIPCPLIIPPSIFQAKKHAGISSLVKCYSKFKRKQQFPVAREDKETQTDPSITENYDCCRRIPYTGMRKERNWFYFYIHQSRTFSPDFRKNFQQGRKIRLKRTAKNRKIPVSMHFRQLKQNPPLITVNRSLIHRIGVFADEFIPENTYLMEYVGELVRNSLVDKREKEYRQKGFGSYMFRLDKDFTIDATLKGCPARFINHSCEPNCIAKVVTHENKKHIVLISSKNIKKGEEICYDYKMPKEDEKMPCLCNTPSCRKYIN